MARLIYTAITSLDGYVADETGNFEWAEPDDDVSAFVNDLERPVGTHLYGRRMYEVMKYWEGYRSMDERPSMERPPRREPVADWADIWRGADKIVYSRTLEAVSSARTRIQREFDPAAVRHLKETSGRDLTIGGPELAAQAFRAGLVDECHLLLNPVVVGGGNRALPAHVRLPLELLGHHRFDNGVVHLHYRVAG